jgi:WD40 repeat protein
MQTCRAAYAIRESLAAGHVDGRAVVIAGTFAGSVHVSDAADGAPIRPRFSAHAGPVQGAAYVEIDAKPLLVTGSSSGGDMFCWDVGANPPKAQSLGSYGSVFAIESLLIDDRPCVAFEGFNHQIVLWDLTKGAQIRPPFEGHSANLFCLRSCTVGGRLLLASSGQGPGIRLWDVRAGAPPAIIDTSRSWTAGLAFGPWQGQTALFSGSYRGEILVWDPEDGRPLGGDFQAHAEPINTIVIGQTDGATVGVSGSADQTLAVWRPTGEILHRVDLGSWILAIKPIGADRMAVGTAKGLLVISFPGLSFEGL